MVNENWKVVPPTGDNLKAFVNSQDSTIHNVTKCAEKLSPLAVQRDSKGRLLPGSVLNPTGEQKKETNITLIIRDRLNLPCDYCPELTWAEAYAKREMEQSLNDPLTRKHLLDRLYGRATESIKLGSDGTAIPITIVEVVRGYVKDSETKQIEDKGEVDNNKSDSAPLDTK